jgi:hypothetical protein
VSAAPAGEKPKAKKKPKGPSPNSLTMKRLEAAGYGPAQVVETLIPYTFIKRDLFGFIDIVAGDPLKRETLAIQACSAGRAARALGTEDEGRGSDVAARVKKIREHENYPGVLAMGWRVEVWAWFQTGPDDWELRRVEVGAPIVKPTPFDDPR